MEHNTTEHSDLNVILLTLVLFFNFAKSLFTPEITNILQGLVLIMLIIINFDKLIKLSTEWYLKIKSWLTKK